MGGTSWWRTWRTQPLLGELVRRRKLGLLMVGVAAVQVAITASGMPSWSCPWRAVTGTPCPGCGLSRACVAIVGGDWGLGMRLHPFAPLVLATLALVAVSAVLPGQLRGRLAHTLEAIEGRTGAGLVVGALLVVHAIARIALGIDPDRWWRPPV